MLRDGMVEGRGVGGGDAGVVGGSLHFFFFLSFFLFLLIGIEFGDVVVGIGQLVGVK